MKAPLFGRFNSFNHSDAPRRADVAATRVHGSRHPALRALVACLLVSLLFGQAAASAVARKGAPKAARVKRPAAKAAGATAKSGDEAAAAQPSPTQQTPAPPSPIAIEAPEVYAYPSDDGLKKYALVVKRKDGDGNFFSTDPSLISLSLTPAGAADITIRRVTPTRIEADFRAPDNYKVSDVGVTVYDGKDRQLVVASSDVKKAPEAPKPVADDKPEITSTAIVFLQRAYGIGRLKIEGKNFGNNYKAPPMSAEDYLLCFEPLARQALVNALRDGEHPDIVGQQKLEDQRCKNLTTTVEKWNDWRKEVEPLVKVALVPRNTDLRIEQTKILYIDDKLIDVYFEFNRYYHNSEPLRLASTTVTVKKRNEQQPGAKPQPTGGQSQTADARGADGASVINAVMSTGAGKDEVRPALSPSPDLKTFIATKEVGTKQDENLEYRYTVLDNNSAGTLFGKGVADNFYVIQLSVTNKGDKKVAVPLASVQAEVEWAYGLDNTKDQKQTGKPSAEVKNDAAKPGGNKFSAPALADTTASAAGAGGAEIPFSANDTTKYYEEGPATLAPLPLPAVTAFFDGDEKVNGKKAKLFNVFDGAAILGSSLFPFFGPGFRDAHGAFTGGLVPGLRRGLGDLSGQQLQNLAALSWQSVEVVAAKGGSVEKFVFIQRRDQVFSTGFGETLRKQIKNIEGMEVVGYEVIESEAKRATPAGQQ
jgi:hypothetical protein